MRRLLYFTAHPDDEAGSFGGTLLHYAERGIETHVICLTRKMEHETDLFAGVNGNT
jgi:LmbE family N-acetylglucosaminyl deacetylase